MSSERIYTALLFICVVLIASGCVERSLTSQEPDRIVTPAPTDNPEYKKSIQIGLGSLCSGEEGCKDFCLNNQGRCEKYCKSNQNELCSKVFSPSPMRYSDQQQANCISNPEPILTHSFTDISKIRSISPPGGIAVGSQSRSYVFAKMYANGSYPTLPIYAPADGLIEAITYAMRGSAPNGRPEYRLDMRISCEATIHFDHIPYVIDEIKDAGPSTPASNTRTGSYVSIPIKAGELLGYTDGAFVPGFDFYLLNTAKPLEHINPTRWTSDHNKYADCPYDYFTSDLKAQYYSYFASAGGTIQKNPVCRSASRDVAGTLAGGWFVEDSTDLQGTRLLIGSDFGDWVDLVIDRDSQPRFYVRDVARKDPFNVHVGESICYSDNANFAYIKFIASDEIAVVSGKGTCPSSLPQTGYETYHR